MTHSPPASSDPGISLLPLLTLWLVLNSTYRIPFGYLCLFFLSHSGHRIYVARLQTIPLCVRNFSALHSHPFKKSEVCGHTPCYPNLILFPSLPYRSLAS